MADQVVIRKPTFEETPRIHEIHMESIRELCAKDYTDQQLKVWSGRQYDRDARRKALEQDWVRVVVVNDEIEGYGHLKITPPTGYLEAIYFSPRGVGHGAGRVLMEMMEDELKKQGIKLFTLNSTRTSLPFYEKLGFAKVGQEKLYPVQGVGIPCIPMEKKL